MEPKDDNIQERLLAHLPKKPTNAGEYRKEVAALLAKNDKWFLREKWGARAMWLFCVGLCTCWMMFFFAGMPKDARFGCAAGFCLIVGAVELLKHFINRSRLELLKEIKQVQLQVLELQDALSRR